MAKKRRSGNQRRAKPRARASATATSGGGPSDFLSSSAGLVAVGGVAIVVVLAMIFMGGGLAEPTAELPTVEPAMETAVASAATAVESVTDTLAADSLAACDGEPCPGLGSPDAPLTIVEVSDFACGHCKTFHEETVPTVLSEYVDTGKARFVSHVFGFYDPSREVSAAALCAHEQGAYFQFQALAFAGDFALLDQSDIQGAVLEAGRELVDDVDAFEACVTEGRYVDLVRTTTQDAMTSGVQYTPTILIGDDLVEGAVPTDQFLQRIDDALAKVADSGNGQG